MKRAPLSVSRFNTALTGIAGLEVINKLHFMDARSDPDLVLSGGFDLSCMPAMPGVVFGVFQRNVRVQEYRGSTFDENVSPFLISKTGFEVAVARTLGEQDSRHAQSNPGRLAGPGAR